MRKGLRRFACAAVLAGCCPGAFAQTIGRGDLQGDYLSPLRAASCPSGTERTAPEDVALSVSHVPLQGINPSRRAIGGLTFVDGFHLTSPDKRFGGLSGLDVLDDGNLLAVSDQGDFVWIDLSGDGVTPVAARIAGLRDAAGDGLRGKAEGDAEGLALNDGLALVSFERDHRVLAYDIGACGAAARGAPIVFGPFGGDLPSAFARRGLKVDGNSGAEAVAVTPDWFLFAGLETQAGGASVVSARPLEAPPEFDIAIGKSAPPMVGMDILPAGKDGRDVRVFSLHRSTSPIASKAIVLIETIFRRELDQAHLPARRISEIDERSHERFAPVSTRVLAEMNLMVTIDNFESVAAKALPDGRVRLYVVSDDNFAKRQRTLLMIYDIAGPG